MQGKSIMKTSVKILLCILLVLVLVQGVQAAETYQFVTKWGTPGSGDGQFQNPRGIAVDSSGNVYVVDAANYRIQKFDSTGKFLAKWGTPMYGNGWSGPSSYVAIDSSGNVYVTNPGLHWITKFSSNGTLLAKWGTPGSGDGQFSYPEGVAVDSSGNVYVAEYGNNRTEKFSSDGTFLTKWGTPGSGDGQFSYPEGIAGDSSGNVYIADTNNHRIQKFDSTGKFLTKWGTEGSGEGQFYYPYGVAVDMSGNVYVADTHNARIQKFSSDGTFLTKWGSRGSGDGQFSGPYYIASDSIGNIYVVDDDYNDNQRIQKFSREIQVPSTPAIISINPNTALNTRTVNVTDITGTGFMYGAGVKLTKTGSPDINATGVAVVPPAKITCTFDLTGKSTGQWSVVVTNPNGTTITLANGFNVTGEAPPLSVAGIFPSTGINDQSISATVTGTDFKPGAVVRLTLAGQPDIVASGVNLIGDSMLTCTFDLTKKATGTWDLAVTNPGDGTTSVRSIAFTLTNFPITNTNGTIIISSTPQDALVYLDGSLKGSGSVTLQDVSPGEHSVRVVKTMYNDYGTDVRVAAGSITYVNAVLTPVSGISGTIIASSNPEGANVYLDGMDKGISPVTITGVSSGFHTVSFTKTDYTAASRSVTMTAGQTTDITVDLTKTGGDLGDLLNTTTLIIVGIVVLILVIIGVLLRKKKNRWDNS